MKYAVWKTLLKCLSRHAKLQCCARYCLMEEGSSWSSLTILISGSMSLVSRRSLMKGREGESSWLSLGVWINEEWVRHQENLRWRKGKESSWSSLGLVMRWIEPDDEGIDLWRRKEGCQRWRRESRKGAWHCWWWLQGLSNYHP